jgi:hypothetical protein
MADKVFMRPPDGGDPKEVEATPDVLVPLLVAGWCQCTAPDETKEAVTDGESA